MFGQEYSRLFGLMMVVSEQGYHDQDETDSLTFNWLSTDHKLNQLSRTMQDGSFESKVTKKIESKYFSNVFPHKQ